MKHLWRISQFASLDGEGGRLASARWHTAGKPIVYLTETPSASLLEFLAAFEVRIGDIPRSYPLLHVEVPEDAPVHAVDERTLPHTWKREIELTRFLGDAWLEAKEHLFLIVPSVLCHATWNWLLNPEHSSAGEVRIVEALRPALDARLLPRRRTPKNPAAARGAA